MIVLQANAHPIQFPIGAEDKFLGMVDLSGNESAHLY